MAGTVLQRATTATGAVRSVARASRLRGRPTTDWRAVLACASAVCLCGPADPARAQAQVRPDCAAIEETAFEDVARCMSLEQLAAQLSAFNQHIGRRVTGNTLEENVRAGLGTAMGVTVDPERVRELQQLAQDSGNPPLFFFADSERGVRTILPSSLAQSFTWDLDLVEAGGRLAARESAIAGYTGILGPVADHSCTTRNGRSMETKGESPYLSALYVERLVRGIQGDSLADPDSVAATLKHWIGYQCSADGTDYRGAGISELELLETHAPPFEAGFRAGAAMYMPAFTQLQGIPMTMNAAVNNRLRGLLGGAHAVSIGDHTADMELIEHGVAGDVCDAALKSFQGGLHISLQGGSYFVCLPDLVRDGAIARADVEARVIDVLRLKQRLGLYEDRLRYGRPDETDVWLSPEHRALARRLGREALVLLTKPDDMPLPLAPDSRILVTGPLAENRQAMLGQWSAQGRPRDVVTACAGLERAFGRDQVACVPMAAHDLGDDDIAAAVAAAAEVDAVVVMLGETRDMSGEASSRLYPGIPASQYALVEALKGTGKPVIAIVTAGRALPVSRLAGLLDDRGAADVVLFTSQLGVEAGNALADVLSGQHPPSGRLSVSLPCETGIISATFRDRRNGRPHTTISPLIGEFRQRINNDGKWVSAFQETIGRADCPIAFPFGHGLSYTDFSFSDLTLSADTLAASDPDARIEASVVVTNEGDYPGIAVPQLYLRDMVAVPAPRRLVLRGFERVELMPGESARVTFAITPDDLAIYQLDPETGALEAEHGRQPQPDPYPVVVFIGASSDVSDATPQGSFVLVE